MSNFEISVALEQARCFGCTHCMKHCPTEAIRVRRGRAIILKERCIDCGNCIRVCPYRAKKAVTDPFDLVANYEYTVALPAPALYGQFHNLSDVNIVLTALKSIGFNDVCEVSRACELVSDITRKQIVSEDLPHPYISSACPVAVRLVQMRFPALIPNISNLVQPAELAAKIARREAVEKTGLPPEKIGIFYISPCPAQVTTARSHDAPENRVIDGVLSMQDVYKRLLAAMKRIDTPEQLSSSGIVGIGWARSGGEASGLLNQSYLAVDGIDNIIKVLEDIEADMLPEIGFLELTACTQGCVGGCMTAENPYVAKGRISHLMKYLPVSRNKADEETTQLAEAHREYEHHEVWRLDSDRTVAMEKYVKIEKLKAELPKLDCGSCGAPSCRALAEDIVLGFASEDDCIFKMRERMQYMTGVADAEAYLPPPFRKGDAE